MPNWCNNTLTISGNTHAIYRLLEAIISPAIQTENEYSLGSLYPTPVFEEEDEPSRVMPAWWDWRVSNWGTKWDPTIYGEQFDEFLENYKRGNFWETVFTPLQSAWSPPIGLLERIAEMFPELTFELSYYETGCCFKGERRWEDGKETHSEDSELTWQDYLDMEITDLSGIIELEMATKEEIVAAGYATEEEVDEIMTEMEE